MKKKLVFILLTLPFVCIQNWAQKTSKIAFYNVENLFDTIDNPNDDAEFLPSAKNEWNTKKYEEKLSHIREVLLAIGKPVIAGFSEIENAGVVRDIIRNQKDFKTYGLVHYESPDARGIDVALIYDSSKLKLLQSDRIRFILPGEEKATTRDILWAQFGYKKSSFYVMVNHWPSRRGGTDESDAKRVFAANVAAKFIDSLNWMKQAALLNSLKGKPVSIAQVHENLIFLGDLNDHPENTAPLIIDERLDPKITKDSGPTHGTHFYNNEWGILDHIYVSTQFSCKTQVVPNSGKIYNFPFLMEEYKGNIQPKRTYAGTKYLGGYSDHLPVSIDIILK